MLMVSGVAMRLVSCAASASSEVLNACHQSAGSSGASLSTAVPIGLPGSNPVSSARHITESSTSRQTTHPRHAG